MYKIPERLKNIECYNPVTKPFRIRLDANESFLDLPDSIRTEVAKAVSDIDFNRYPDPMAEELCEKFGEFFQIKPQFLTAGNGSDELISLIVLNFLEKGDTMLTVMPDFSMYGFYANAIGVRVEAVEKEEDMALSAVQVIKQAREKKARLVIFSNPCNPTAFVAKREDILQIVEQLDALVVVDEAYMDFSEGSVLSEIEQYENLIVLKTFSKAFGMAAIRLGFAAANESLTRVLRGVKSPYNVNSMTQAVGCVLLKHPDYLQQCIEKICSSREDLYEKLKKLEENKQEIEKVYATSTNFVYLKVQNAEKIFKKLQEQGISIRYMNGYLRVTAGSPEENQEVVSALEELLA